MGNLRGFRGNEFWAMPSDVKKINPSSVLRNNSWYMISGII